MGVKAKQNPTEIGFVGKTLLNPIARLLHALQVVGGNVTRFARVEVRQ